MAPNISLQHARTPNSGRRRQLLLPAILQHIQQTRHRSETSTANSISMSPLISLSDLSDALETPVTTSKHNEKAKSRGVRFNNKVSVVEIPPEQVQARRVSFSDEVIDIDTAESTASSPSPSAPKKRVRFGCLKNSVRKHLAHTPIYKMKNFDAISPLLTPKKRVRFGCMKCETPAVNHSSVELSELLAEEAATFKREKRRGSMSTEDSEMSMDSEDVD